MDLLEAPRVGIYRNGQWVAASLARRGVNGPVVWVLEGGQPPEGPPTEPPVVDPPDVDPDPDAGTTSYPAALSTANVSTSPGLQSALNAASSGKHIVLANGTYVGDFSISAAAAEASPIVIRAANRGQATLSGRITIGGGSDVWLWGLDFSGRAAAGGCVVVTGMRHKIIGCRFADFGSSTSFTRSEAITTGGRTDFLEIGYCMFEDPRSFRSWTPSDGSWPQWRFGFRSWPQPAAAPYDLNIHHCHFKNFPAKPTSDYGSAQSDAIEIAYGGSNFDGRTRIHRCLFENIPDDSGSIVDAKAAKLGVIEYCTALNCAGRMDLRDCDDWAIRHIWMENCQGIGVFGKNHLIKDVIMSGGARRIMLHIGNGPYTLPPGTIDASGQVRRQVSDTTVECCVGANIRVGYDWAISPAYLPRNVTIRGSGSAAAIAPGCTNITQSPGYSCAPSEAFKLAPADVGPGALP
jgi:hypothetical protein